MKKSRPKFTSDASPDVADLAAELTAAQAAYVKLVETCTIYDIAHAAYEAAYLARASAIDAYNSATIATWRRTP